MPLFFLSKILHCTHHILARFGYFYHFLFLNWNFLKIALNFFKIKNLTTVRSPCNVLSRQPMLHEFNLCCSRCGMKEVLLRRNTRYIGMNWNFFSNTFLNEIMWIRGIIIIILFILISFVGYSLIWTQISYWGII